MGSRLRIPRTSCPQLQGLNRRGSCTCCVLCRCHRPAAASGSGFRLYNSCQPIDAPFSTVKNDDHFALTGVELHWNAAAAIARWNVTSQRVRSSDELEERCSNRPRCICHRSRAPATAFSYLRASTFAHASNPSCSLYSRRGGAWMMAGATLDGCLVMGGK